MGTRARACLYALTASLIFAFHHFSYAADDSIVPLKLCEQRYRDGTDFDPVSEFAKSAAISELGAQGGRTLSDLAASLVAKGFFIRQAGILAGRLLVWIFEASNPVAVAIGFVMVPSTPAKCDVLLSDDPDCLKQNPCIQPFSSVR